MPSIIEWHNKKVTEVNIEKMPSCNCRNKQDCSLGGKMSDKRHCIQMCF